MSSSSLCCVVPSRLEGSEESSGVEVEEDKRDPHGSELWNGGIGWPLVCDLVGGAKIVEWSFWNRALPNKPCVSVIRAFQVFFRASKFFSCFEHL